ncbi:putative 2'-5' RNA ligase [Methylocaldum marinum]|uniref:RNA 2',3'-cyclic phosphodiesterase n=1 Tax=Methylocaldum marinum TaxID=1432792 RepID=A0A250KUG7_9GAMM|nr:RNA 2',3'-cyclic phosphodiesterase [Methylocaldum marinum]BBA34601.1 putative 2'-5' RNA ligase [Methylocaldum marinum]
MSAEIKTLRLFFALWPDEEMRASLARLVDALKQTATGKWVKPENLHITLVFLGAVNEDRIASVNEVAEGIVAQPFELRLDRIEFWKKSGIICLSPTCTPVTLQNLANALTAELKRTGFVTENRPYRAHLTVARKGSPGVLSSRCLDDPICWSVRSFSLVESRTSRMGSLYQVRKIWNLPSR